MKLSAEPGSQARRLQSLPASAQPRGAARPGSGTRCGSVARVRPAARGLHGEAPGCEVLGRRDGWQLSSVLDALPVVLLECWSRRSFNVFCG